MEVLDLNGAVWGHAERRQHAEAIAALSAGTVALPEKVCGERVA